MSEQRDPTKPEDELAELDEEQAAQLKKAEEVVEKIKKLEEKREASKTVPILPCGHEDSFEHRLVEGMLTLSEIAYATGNSAVEPCIDFLQRVCSEFYIQLPTHDEMIKIMLSKKMNPNNTQEVN
jgi:uncharacterized protein YutE (UPF0331/DUF86 family)